MSESKKLEGSTAMPDLFPTSEQKLVKLLFFRLTRLRTLSSTVSQVHTLPSVQGTAVISYVSLRYDPITQVHKARFSN